MELVDIHYFGKRILPTTRDFKSVAATSGRRRVYQNKLLPYKAEQFFLAGFDTPSSCKFLLNAQIHAARSIKNARSMKAAGISPELIVQITGLTPEAIAEL